MKSVRALTCVAVLSMLAACGGGGGGGSGGGSQGALTLMTDTLRFETTGTVTPQPQIVSARISGNVSGTVYLRIVSTGPAVLTIDSVLVNSSDSTGQGRVVPASAATLGPGVHTSTVTVTACTSNVDCTSGVIGSPQTLSVTYTISGIDASTAPLAYAVGFNPAAGDLTKVLTVRAHPTFTPTADVNWLTFAPGSGGSGTTQLNVNLVPSIVDALASGNHAGTLTLTAPAGQPVRVPVSLTITKPQLDLAMPYVAGVNQSATVIVRGHSLDRLSGGSIDLVAPDGSSRALASVTTVSPTTLEVTHPDLPVGTYAFRMRDAQGQVIDRSTARLVVVDNTIYSSQFISYPGGPVIGVSTLMFDAERRALRLAGRVGLTVNDNVMLTTEYDTATSTWGTVSLRPYPALDNVVMSADGMTLVATSREGSGFSGYGRIAQLSPTTLEQKAAFLSDAGYSTFPRLVALSTNDMLVVQDSPEISGPGEPLYRYVLKANTMTRMTSPDESFFTRLIRGTLGASGNGQRAIAGSGGNFGRVYEYTASAENALRTSQYLEVQEIDMDRSGDTVLLRAREQSSDYFVRVYDRSWTPRGSLPVSNYGHVLSPDGSRAYGYRGDGDQLHVFDLTAAPVGGFFPEIQTITLAGNPSDFTLTVVPMALSPDGRVLFIAGRNGIVVQTLP